MCVTTIPQAATFFLPYTRRIQHPRYIDPSSISVYIYIWLFFRPPLARYITAPVCCWIDPSLTTTTRLTSSSPLYKKKSRSSFFSLLLTIDRNHLLPSSRILVIAWSRLIKVDADPRILQILGKEIGIARIGLEKEKYFEMQVS